MSDLDNLDNPYTSAIANFVSGLQYDDIPAEVRSRIKLLILDSLGCALYGPSLPWSQILLKTLAHGDSSDTSGVWGTNQRLSPANAALVNGTLVQGFELDDVHTGGFTCRRRHPARADRRAGIPARHERKGISDIRRRRI